MTRQINGPVVSPAPKQQTATAELPHLPSVATTIAGGSDPVQRTEPIPTERIPQAFASLGPTVSAGSAPGPVDPATAAVPSTPPRHIPSIVNSPLGTSPVSPSKVSSLAGMSKVLPSSPLAFGSSQFSSPASPSKPSVFGQLHYHAFTPPGGGASLAPSPLHASPSPAGKNGQSALNMSLAPGYSSFGTPATSQGTGVAPQQEEIKASTELLLGGKFHDPTQTAAEGSSATSLDVNQASNNTSMTLLSGSYDEGNAPPAERIVTPNLYLSDLESYKIQYDGTLPCETNDPDLHDPILAATYVGLWALMKRWVYTSFLHRGVPVPPPGSKGGGVWFSVWGDCVSGLTQLTASSAMLLVQSGVFVNAVRVDPRKMMSAPTKENGPNRRLNVNGKVAIFVSAGLCTQSHIIDVIETTGPVVRCHKFIYMTFHNQDWERWMSFMCLCFGQPHLFANMYGPSIQFGTMLIARNSASSHVTSDPIENWGNPALTSHIPASKNSSAPSTPQTPNMGRPTYSVSKKYALMPDDKIPAYNAVGINFDLPNLDSKLAPWSGDIPKGSFIVVGYTATTFQGNAAGQSGKQEHIGCNILWIVVCGVPKRD
ncbi:hypothetical protein DFH06DRAFT_1318022 [Mycena polygramma]|nr:hypothetical protein DFH06DRAFT_1318022 [Mycena polygramma]